MPPLFSHAPGRVPKWSKGTDCKSVIRGFESHLGLFAVPPPALPTVAFHIMSKTRTFPGVALLLIALLFPAANARAWNASGHQVIAEIAWRNLTPAVRDKVLTLLKQHPHFAKRLDSTEPN